MENLPDNHIVQKVLKDIAYTEAYKEYVGEKGTSVPDKFTMAFRFRPVVIVEKVSAGQVYLIVRRVIGPGKTETKQWHLTIRSKRCGIAATSIKVRVATRSADTQNSVMMVNGPQ